MPSAYRVAASSIRIVPWAALASCWPLPQQLLPVSAAGGGRRRCALGIFSGKIILISRLSRPAGRSKRIFTGGVVKADGIFVVYLASLSVKAGFRNARRRFFTKQKSGHSGGQAECPVFVFFASAVVPNTAGAAPEAAEQTVLPLPVEKRKEWRNGAERLQTLLFFWCNVVRIS